MLFRSVTQHRRDLQHCQRSQRAVFQYQREQQHCHRELGRIQCLGRQQRQHSHRQSGRSQRQRNHPYRNPRHAHFVLRGWRSRRHHGKQRRRRLRPVTFRYKQPFNDGSKPVQYGLVAEEVAEVYPDLVAHSADGQIETVKYQVLDSMLLNELQKEHQQVQQLQTRIAALEQLLSGNVPPAAPTDQ